DAGFDQRLVLFLGESRRFARRATGNQSMRAAFYMPIDQTLEGVKIDLTVLERRDKRNDGSFEHGGVSSSAPTLPFPRRVGKRLTAGFSLVFTAFFMLCAAPANAVERDWQSAVRGNDPFTRKLAFWLRATDTD